MGHCLLDMALVFIATTTYGMIAGQHTWPGTLLAGCTCAAICGAFRWAGARYEKRKLASLTGPVVAPAATRGAASGRQRAAA